MVDIFDSSLDNIEVEISDNKVSKGEEINLTNLDPTLNNLVIGVGWTLNAFDADSLDLDISCFMLDKDNLTRENEDFVFYNNLEGCDGAVVHNGDSLIGAGDGDDESLSIDLNGIPFDIMTVMFVFSIYRGEEKNQTMESVKNPYIRLINASNSQELIRYELVEDAQNCTDTAMFAASLTRMGPKWHFNALGDSASGGLSKVANDYGIIIQAS